jgi:hypothetical protein
MKKLSLAALVTLALATPANSACYIEASLCGLSSIGAASEFINTLPDWTIAHSHTMGLDGHGQWFVDFTLDARQKGGLCYAFWASPVGAFSCPDSSNSVSGNVISRPFINK